jgi:hypothetical protein
MTARLLRPNRKGTLASLAVGVLFAAVGAAMLDAGSRAGIAVCVIGAVGLYGAIGGIVPGQGLRLDEQGFRLRSFGKSWGADWLETAGFTPDRVRVGRYAGRGGDVDVVRIEYVPGVGDGHLPHSRVARILGVDERYLIAAYGGLSNTELAELLEHYRARG